MTERQRDAYDRVLNASRYLSLQREQLGDAEAQAVAEALKENTVIGDAGAKAIAEALRLNKTLQHLYLQQNQIGDDGALAIAQTLRVNTTLHTLYLNDNQLGDGGAQAIAEALTVNGTLATLSLGENQIGDAGARATADALKVNKALTELHLSGNQIGDAGAQAIAEALKLNTTLTQFYFYKNQVGDAGAQAIAEALKVNSSLTEVNLDTNQIGDAGAQAIAEALKVNTTLTALKLNNNCISDVGVQAIDGARNGTLTNLVISRQINPLAFSLLPRKATAEDTQTVFRLLIRGPELNDQSAHLPLLPAEIAERIMDEAYYFPGIQRTKREWFLSDQPNNALKVTMPRSIDGNSIRVKAIQVLRAHLDVAQSSVFELIVRDEHVTHPIIRQMREGWEIQLRPWFAQEVLLESLYVGYV
ncbi:NOD3 protein [Capsaspora owczarzaki ATCC 30864]|uniref:NOD3 protein n=1 Tax=Capsaspora owczarzaki (strain ATCC 30864) TaxID=595528 RepID=UPI0001FE2981|nr:NOD3 protein [Capsaspora owczarzaki ATCC 30864]|eukprot:XP_004365854.1 NOD3 protein [Capsaspora owczarzaki ATCC 30864]